MPKKTIRVTDELAGLVDWALSIREDWNLQTMAARAVKDSGKTTDVGTEDISRFTTSGEEYLTFTSPALVALKPAEIRNALAHYLIPKAKAWADQKHPDIAPARREFTRQMKALGELQARHGIFTGNPTHNR